MLQILGVSILQSEFLRLYEIKEKVAKEELKALSKQLIVQIQYYIQKLTVSHTHCPEILTSRSGLYLFL